MKSRSILTLCFLAATAAARAADPPTVVNYQGVLRDALDKPKAGTFDMVFRFFDAASAGNEILVDSHTGGGGNAVIVTNGLFNAPLGGGTVADGAGPGTYVSLSQVFRDFGAVWLEIKIGAETLAPRIQVQASAYALNASNLEGQPAANFLDVSGTGQTKGGRLTIADPSSAAGNGLTVSTQGSAAVQGTHTTTGAYGQLGANTIGVYGAGSYAGGSFADSNNSGSANVGYGDSGITANGNSAGGVFTDNSGDSATIAEPGYGLVTSSGSYGGDFYGSGVAGISCHGPTGGLFGSTVGSGSASIASGAIGGTFYGTPAANFSTSANGYATLATGNTGIDASGLYPSSAGHFKDVTYSGEAFLTVGDEGISAKGTWAAGEFSNASNNSVVMLAANNPTASNAAGYFWNPQASNGSFYLGVYTYLATATYGSSSSGLFTNGGKNFVQNHPFDTTRAIVYTSLEGPEAGTYTRGSGRTERGMAHVPLDPTFALTTDPDVGLTAGVTPRGAWADLYVVSVSTSELVVATHDPQAPAAEFDYMVNGLRLGFEEGATIVPKEHLPNSTVMPLETAEARLALLPADARASTPLARFAAQGRARGEREAPDLSRARELIAAIDSLDQANHSLPDPAAFGARRVSERVAGEAPRTPEPAERAAPRVARPAEGVAAKVTDEIDSRPVVPPGAWMVRVIETVEPGDVLSNDPTHPGELVRASIAADPGVVGIAAGEKGDAWSAAVPIALPGTIVLCNVDAQYGAIDANDLLVASPSTGRAMRAGENPREGTIVAKALEAWPSGPGTIRVLVLAH